MTVTDAVAALTNLQKDLEFRDRVVILNPGQFCVVPQGVEHRTCADQEAAVRRALARFPGTAIAYRHYPLPIHPTAEDAARAAVCAELQGRFPEMHRHLYQTQAWITDTAWLKHAAAAGIPDLAAFGVCLRAPETTDRLARDKAFALDLGVRGTPAFVWRGGVWQGMMSDSALLSIMGGR